MKIKDISLNHIKNFKISKNGILENDKHLLINKLGFHNLSQLNLTHGKEKRNNICKKQNSISTIKYEKKNLNKSSIFIKIKKYHSNSNSNNINKKIILSNTNKENIKNNNISTFSSNEIINDLNKHRITCKSNKTSKDKILFNKNKSYGNLQIKPLINIKTIPNIKYMNKYGRNKNFINSFKTTATNSYKDIKSIQNMNSSKKLSDVYPFSKIKIIKKNKNINKLQKDDKLNKTVNMISLLNDVKNQKIKNKEQSYKIFNNNIFINNNLYNDSSNNKSKDINNKNRKSINKYILDSPERNNINDISNNNEIMNKPQNNSNQIKIIKNKSINSKLNNEKNKNDEIKKSIISVSNENSEDTRKESGLDLHKIFDDKTFINIDKNNIINEIISNNMKIKFNHKNSYKNNNNNHNQNINIRNDSTIYNDFNNNEKQKHLNYFNHLIKKNSYEQNKILNDSTKNENFSSINENNDNINKFYQSSKIFNHLKDLQIPIDKNSVQTCTTGDKFYKVSKYLKQSIYNISNRYLSDNVTFRSKSNIPNKNFKFIYDIIRENKDVVLIDIRKILKLNDISIFKLLSFSYDNYSSIIRSNTLLRNKINISLKNIFQHVIDDFKLKYNNFLNVLDFCFKPKTISISGKINYLFNLIIKCQITSKEIKKSYEIGCDYISFGKKYDNKWKFDVHKKEDIKIWICSELDVINNAYKKFSYTSQVASFCYGDIIELQFNIFSKGNNIDPISIEWVEPIISNSKPYFYQNSKFITSIKYDQLRACEVETQILFWKNILPKDDDGIINDFKKIFEIFFKIKSISYYVSKFYFFKFTTVANKKGWLKQNKFCTFDINIIDYEESIKNEIQCIYLMNSNYYKKTMDIRIGTYVIFYLVDMKR